MAALPLRTVLHQVGLLLLLVDVHQRLVVGARLRVIAEQDRGLGSRPEAEEVAGPNREARFGHGERGGAVSALRVEQREVEAVVQREGGDQVVGGDGHRQELGRLGHVARLDRRHHPDEESVGGLSRRHRTEIDGRGGPQRGGGTGRAVRRHGRGTLAVARTAPAEAQDDRGDRHKREDRAGGDQHPVPGGAEGRAAPACQSRAAEGAEAVAGLRRGVAGRTGRRAQRPSAARAEVGGGALRVLAVRAGHLRRGRHPTSLPPEIALKKSGQVTMLWPR